MDKPLEIIIKEAKSEIDSVYKKVANESKLPPFLLEEIVLDLLSDIREQKYLNLLSMIGPKEGEILE